MNIHEESVKFKNSKGIQRFKMPQIASDDMNEFMQYLTDQGVKHVKTKIPVRDLKPTQTKYNSEKVDKMTELGNEVLSKTIICSSDNYITDGHHRYQALLNKNPKHEMNVIQANVNIDDLLKYAEDFPKSFKAGINETTKPFTLKSFRSFKNRRSIYNK